MDKKKVRRIVAREGLIILGIVSILYCAQVFLFPQMHFSAPKYRLELTDGKIDYAIIGPEYGNENVYTKEFMRKMFHPSSSLVAKRLEQWKEINKVGIMRASPVNSWQKSIMESLAFFVVSSLLLQTIVIYFLVSLIRFIIWAVKTLSEK